MSFAQEIRDFTSAFKAMNDALGDPLDRASKQADIDWKNAQRDKWRWDMGAEDRERQDILSFGSTSEIPWGTQPSFTPTSLKGLGTTGSNVNIAGFSNEFGSGLSRMYADMPDNIKQAVRVRSGYRPYDQQYDIYYRQGIRPAAKPGNSRHEFGMALDWDFGSSDAKRWVYQNAGNYGFEFPLPDSDPNHMQYAAFKGPRGEDASRAYQRSLSGRQVASLDDISLPGTEAVGLVDDEAVRGMEGMFGGEMGRYRDAIGRMETGGEKNPYGTVHKGGALGRYGVMPSNLAAFTQQVLGTVMTPEQFLSSPEAQDKVFDSVFGGYMQKYGSPEAAALAWFTGPLNEDSLKDADLNNFSGNDYVQRFQQQMRAPGATTTSALTMPYDDGTPNPRPRPGGAPGVAGLPNPTMRPEQAGDIPNTEAVSTTGGGFDPFPQTSGHMDAVSQAGNENMNPAAARRVARGEGSNVHIRTLLQGVFGGVKKRLGGTTEAVATGPNKVDQAIMSGAGAAHPSLVQQMEQAIDPNNELPEGLRHIRAMKKIYDYYRLAGKPEKAEMVTYAIAQTYRGMANQMLGIAQNAAEEGDVESAIQAFQEAYSLVPDGESLNVEPRGDGTFKIDTIDDETGKVITSRVMSARDIMAQIMQITPAEFDTMILKPATGVTGAGEDISTGLADYENIIGDEAVSEGAPPDAEVTPDVPIPPRRPGTTGATPMGTTTIPPDAAGVETAGGIQVASLDPDAGISVEDPDEVIRDEAVAETATGDETEEAVSTAPTGGWTRPFAVDPRTRIKEVDALTTRLRQEGKHDAAAIVEARFERDIKIQTEYDKSIKTAEDRAVVDQFYKLLGETPEDQRFDIPENLFRSMTNATLQRSMQLAAEAHNTAAEKLGDERALQLSNQTLQELTGKYLGDEELSSQVDAGERPELPGLPVIGEAFDYRTPITGAASTKRDRVDFPANDPLVLALNKDDRAEFETRVNAYNQRLDEDKSFERPAPWSMQDMATFDAEFEEAVTNTDAMLENNADPEARAASTSMRDFIKNKGFITDVKSAAMAMMPLNEGMDPEVAYRTALAMAMANHRDPIHSQFRAQRMLPENGYPAGTLMVTQIGNDTPIYIPEHLFKKIDNVRQQVATDFLRGKGRYAMGKAIRPPDRPPSTAGEQMLQNPAESRFGVLPEMLRGVGIEVPEEEESAPYPPPANRFGNIRNPFLEK